MMKMFLYSIQESAMPKMEENILEGATQQTIRCRMQANIFPFLKYKNTAKIGCCEDNENMQKVTKNALRRFLLKNSNTENVTYIQGRSKKVSCTMCIK